APVPVVSVLTRENRLGGAANVSLNIKALGATPWLFSIVGDDDKGRKLKKLLVKENLCGDGIFTDPARLTTVKSRIISKGQHVARVDEECTDEINSDLENTIVEAVQKIIGEKKIDVIVFVDYDKGVITPTLFDRVNEMAISKGIPTAVDPKKRNFRYYKNVSLFKPNFKEFTDGIGVSVEKNDFDKIRQLAGLYQQKQNLEIIFITLSESGVFISNGIQYQFLPANIRYVADVSGAGDSVISVASLALASGLNPEIVAWMSNLAGGLVCEKTGVAPVNKEQLINEMLSQKTVHSLLNFSGL
ncbi:MAG: D-glycero-beta-D-manno-heptose-7-phosphate kinase, partial [Bacteroidetes bacterium]